MMVSTPYTCPEARIGVEAIVYGNGIVTSKRDGAALSNSVKVDTYWRPVRCAVADARRAVTGMRSIVVKIDRGRPTTTAEARLSPSSTGTTTMAAVALSSWAACWRA